MSRGWKKPLLLGCIGVPLLTCGIGGGLVCHRVSGMAGKLPSEVAKLKAHGVATEVPDLAPNPPLSEKENAAQLYGSIGYQLSAITKDPTQAAQVKLLDEFGNSDNPTPDLGKVLRAVQTFQSIFSDADKVSAKSRVNFKRDYSRGNMVLFPEYAHMKRIAKWQCSRARAEWMSGNRTAALKTLQASFRIGEHASQEPHLIGQLVAIAISAINHRTLENFVIDARNDPTLLKKMEDMLANLQDQIELRKAFGGEIVMARATIQNTKGGGLMSAIRAANNPATKDYALMEALFSNPQMRVAFEARYCEAWRIIFDQIPSDPEDWNGFRKVMAEQGQRIEADKSIDNTINRIMFPVLDQAVDAAAKQVAERRVALLSLKLLQTRAKGLPADLSAYGQLAIDPFTNKPMRYERKGKAFKIWSIGMDRIDQGGMGRGKGSGTNGYDIVMGFDMQIPKAKPTQ